MLFRSAFLNLFGAPQNLEPRYNLAPTQRAAVVRHDEQGRRVLSMLRWGLIPIWAKDHKIELPPLKGSTLYVRFERKEDHDAEEEAHAGRDCREATAG